MPPEGAIQGPPKPDGPSSGHSRDAIVRLHRQSGGEPRPTVRTCFQLTHVASRAPGKMARPRRFLQHLMRRLRHAT